MSQDLSELENTIFKDMNRDGCFASADLQKIGFVKWMSSGIPSGYSNLAARMQKEIRLPQDMPYPYHRVADALVQKMRKAGLIKKHGKNWVLTGSGQNFLDFIAEKKVAGSC